MVESLETYITGPIIYTKNHVNIPGRTSAVLNVTADIRERTLGHINFNVQVNRLLINEYPNLIAIPTIHNVRNAQNPIIPCVLVNLSIESVHLPKRELSWQLIPTNDNYDNIPETVNVDICNINDMSNLDNEEIEVEKKFITSPADVEVHWKVELQDADVSDVHKQQFKELCAEFSDIFSKDSGDLGRTLLVIMDIDTGDNPHISQRPYNLPLKHADWVERELDNLEKVGVITRSVSLWASPIVIVPKKAENQVKHLEGNFVLTTEPLINCCPLYRK